MGTASLSFCGRREGKMLSAIETSKLQHVKPRPIDCLVQHLDHSSGDVRKPNHPGNPVVIMTTSALAQSFGE